MYHTHHSKKSSYELIISSAATLLFYRLNELMHLYKTGMG